MSTQTVFNSSTDQENTTQEPVQEEVSPVQPESAFADQLAAIRNERGEPKYKDLPTALEALKHSQEFIPQLKSEKERLEQELDQLREELSKRSTVEEVMEKLTATGVKQETQPQEVPQISQEDIIKLLEQVVPNYITQREEQTKAQQNILTVDKSLKEAFGEKVQEVVLRRSQELGVSPKELEQLSAKSPQMVLQLFDLKPQAKVKPTTSSVNIPPINQPQQGLQKPAKSLLSGASSKEQAEYMRQVREQVYARHGVQS